MRRTFLVLNSASNWQTASTGVPEGCALAVASMLTLSIALYHHVTIASPSTGIFTFADNWSFIMEHFQHAVEVVSLVEKFCSALRLRLSIPKSWTWALTPTVSKRAGGRNRTRPEGRNRTRNVRVPLKYRGSKPNANHAKTRQVWHFGEDRSRTRGVKTEREVNISWQAQRFDDVFLHFPALLLPSCQSERVVSVAKACFCVAGTMPFDMRN